ncbi:hypothetical protein [Aneurinibacillus migulanus]|nr:hypothetical protein [Aneurinibacillus migulanus]
MKLTMVTLYPSMYEMEGTQPEYRLVYEAIPERRSFWNRTLSDAS